MMRSALKRTGRAEEALRDSEARYRTLFEESRDAIYITTPEGVCINANQAMLDLFGYTRAEMLALNARAIYAHPEDRVRFQQEIERHGGVRDYAVKCRKKDGTEMDCLFTVTGRRAEDGRLLEYQSIIRDITERKQVEEERLKLSKLESLGLLAGGIAHDFNNLLTGVLGNLSLAKLAVHPDDPLFARLTRAESASLGAKDLTKQLLTFAQGGTPIKQTISITNLLIESATFALRGSKVRCEWAIPDDLWSVDIDAGQIGQAIQNVVINADQAMPDGGLFTIRCANVTLGTPTAPQGLPLPDGPYVQIAITDQGVGIPASDLPKIFDPYFTTKLTGSGLGLATAYAIIKGHGGTITVDSVPGAGATFTLYLPTSSSAIPPAAPAETEPEQKVQLQGKQGKILVMDDEAIIRELITQSLTRSGYTVACAADGAEAIAFYQMAHAVGLPFDAVIMDLTVPGGMGGKEAVQQLRAINPKVKAIVSSGYSNDPVMANFRQYGFSGMVTKPYKAQDLLEVVQTVLQQSEESHERGREAQGGIPGMNTAS